MRKVLIAILALMALSEARAATPEQSYLAARDRAIAAVKKAGSNSNKRILADIRSALDHLFDNSWISLVEADLFRSRLINTQVSGWAQEAVSQGSSRVLLSCEEQVGTISSPSSQTFSECFAKISLVSHGSDA